MVVFLSQEWTQNSIKYFSTMAYSIFQYHCFLLLLGWLTDPLMLSSLLWWNLMSYEIFLFLFYHFLKCSFWRWFITRAYARKKMYLVRPRLGGINIFLTVCCFRNFSLFELLCLLSPSIHHAQFSFWEHRPLFWGW